MSWVKCRGLDCGWADAGVRIAVDAAYWGRGWTWGCICRWDNVRAWEMMQPGGATVVDEVGIDIGVRFTTKVAV